MTISTSFKSIFFKPVLCVALASSLLACTTLPSKPITLNLVAINDFHGHLEAEKFSYQSAGAPAPVTTTGAGIENIGAQLQAWRQEDPELLFVGGGDLIGASPSISALFGDEPTLDALSQLGMRASALGNHEFDRGLQELKRQQHGGCDSPQPEKACQYNGTFTGAKFSYIAANVIDKASGLPFFPAYHIAQVKGVKVGLIGAVVRGVPTLVASQHVQGLEFIDEADAINRTIPQLKAQGVKVFVVLIHEGGSVSEAFDQPECTSLKGPIVDIVKRLDPQIKLIVSGHSHTGYHCKVEGRTVTQAQNYGHLLTRLTLTVDGVSHEVTAVDARNTVMLPSSAAAPEALSQIVVKARDASRAKIAQAIARLAVPVISRKLNEAGESPLGNLIADAQLAAVKHLGAQIAFMNSKGIRGNLESAADNITTYGHTSTVLPFANTLVLMSLTGAEIRTLLEQQTWLDDESPDGRNILQISEGFTYTWDKNRPRGQRVIAESVKLNDVNLDDNTEYRIVANNFLAGGGDRVPMFMQGKNIIDTGIKDLDVLISFLKAREQSGVPAGSNQAAGRVKRIH
ncbi:MAG: bifunctional metallophosphatase/5'-nucleotidase [Burkholderiales bacterium]|nr:bifunctional metallophosphatase/5'-nucleotidase [Burkholderiales bacterium]